MHRLSHKLCFEPHPYAQTQTDFSSIHRLKTRQSRGEGNNLHNPIPVVPSRHPEECEEGHAKVVKGSVATKTLAWVLL